MTGLTYHVTEYSSVETDEKIHDEKVIGVVTEEGTCLFVHKVESEITKRVNTHEADGKQFVTFIPARCKNI